MLGIKQKLENLFKKAHPWNETGAAEPEPEVLEQDEMDLDQIFSAYAVNPDVPNRMLKMAGFFGLSRQQIAHPNTEAALIVKRCNACAVRSICFKNRDGSAKETPGFKRERCPNLTTYREKALDAEHRTPIHHKLH